MACLGRLLQHVAKVCSIEGPLGAAIRFPGCAVYCLFLVHNQSVVWVGTKKQGGVLPPSPAGGKQPGFSSLNTRRCTISTTVPVQGMGVRCSRCVTLMFQVVCDQKTCVNYRPPFDSTGSVASFGESVGGLTPGRVYSSFAHTAYTHIAYATLQEKYGQFLTKPVRNRTPDHCAFKTQDTEGGAFYTCMRKSGDNHEIHIHRSYTRNECLTVWVNKK